MTSLEYNFIKNNIIHANKYYSKFIRGSGIRLNCISPEVYFSNHGKKFVNNYSKNTNNNSMLDKEDLNTIVEYLISDGSRKITGQNIVVDDGSLMIRNFNKANIYKRFNNFVFNNSNNFYYNIHGAIYKNDL